MKPVLSTLIGVLLVSGSAHAQTAPIGLTLPEAIERGLASNHRLSELLAREDVAKALHGQQESAARPQLSLFGSYMRINHVDEFSLPNATGGVRILYPDIPDIVRSGMDLQWPIYTGGRLQALARATEGEVNAAGYDRETARADLKLEITRAYWAVVTALASQNVVREALARTDAQLNDVRNQLSVGLIPPNDVLSTEAQQARQRMLLIEAENIVESTSAEFRRLIGLEPDTPFQLQTPPPPTVVPPTPSVAQPFSAALEARANRPERRALEFRISAAAERATAASAGSLPVLAALGRYDFARPNPRVFPLQDAWKRSWDLGVNVRWPLFDGGRTRAEVAEATANRRAAESRLRDFDSLIEVEVRQRSADLRSAQASIEAAEAGVRAAAGARSVLAERFGAGVATNTDVLDAQVALLQAELDLTRAVANAQLAAARLDRAMGR
jgi:outer membrane protein